MNKTLEKHNSFQVYIRSGQQAIWAEFLRLIKEDKALLANYKNHQKPGAKGLISYAVMTRIYNYVMQKNPDFKLEK